MTTSSMDPARPSTTSARSERAATAAVAVVVVVGGLLAFLFAGGSVGLMRETLHFNCSWSIGGEWGADGSWACGDGIGYLGVLVVLGGMSGVLLLAGLVVAVVRPSTARSAVYLVFAAVSLAWVGSWTFYAATAYTGARPAGETGASLWISAVLPGLATCALALLIGAVGALTSRHWSPLVLWVGVGLMLLGTALAPGIAVASFVSGAMLTAAGVDRHRTR
ncbi:MULTISPECIES: hypothetical protein [unclassified Microbacterium]|uniref:hypothetical protein n=1 Tax=unclassified Microbacterium TaxID=2609290 RepID=UPI00214BC615|nr:MULTISPECIES: hypothetical protein [unclassified Microbacterium]MCR2784770.1 hypothetical protein [Microbacterium sp. zg.B96]WIM16309.1 hypothetical protein QNO11_01375 [Microbacterium sp. zg-B96]